MIIFFLKKKNCFPGTITQLFGAAESECSVIMLWTYALASISLTIWTTFFMWLVAWMLLLRFPEKYLVACKGKITAKDVLNCCCYCCSFFLFYFFLWGRGINNRFQLWTGFCISKYYNCYRLFKSICNRLGGQDEI